MFIYEGDRFRWCKYYRECQNYYPVEFIPNVVLSGKAGYSKNIFFLTADAFGILSPVSKLAPEGAIYHFLSGYTAKLAGTEVGVI